MGLSVVVLGLLFPTTLSFGGMGLLRLFVVTGGGLLITSVFVDIHRLLIPT